MFERVNERAGTAATLHSLRHTAAYRMAEDPALPLTDVQSVLGHAQLTTTQLYLTPRKEDVIRRVLAHHAGQARQAAGPARPAPAPATSQRPWRSCSGMARRDRRGGDRPGRLAAEARSQGESARARFPARPVALSWPATRQAREDAWEQVTSPPFVLANDGTEGKRVRGLARLLDWLESQPGTTWQDRWQASGVEAAGADWRQLPLRWLEGRGRRLSGCRQNCRRR